MLAFQPIGRDERLRGNVPFVAVYFKSHFELRLPMMKGCTIHQSQVDKSWGCMELSNEDVWRNLDFKHLTMGKQIIQRSVLNYELLLRSSRITWAFLVLDTKANKIFIIIFVYFIMLLSKINLSYSTIQIRYAVGFTKNLSKKLS